MFLFRQINSFIRSGAFLGKEMAKGQAKTTRAKFQLITSLTIFATSAVALGTTLVSKATRGVKNSGSGRKKQPNKQAPTHKESKVYEESQYLGEPKESWFAKRKRENQARKNDPRTKSEREFDELQQMFNEESHKKSPNQEPIDFNDGKIEGIPEGFYHVREYLNKEWKTYMNGKAKYEGGYLIVPLFGNVSSVQWELMTKGTLKGKPTFMYESEEKDKLLAKYDLDRTDQVPKPTYIKVGASGLYDDKGNNYMKLGNEGQILTRLSVDYNKNYIPLFADLINQHYELKKNGFF